MEDSLLISVGNTHLTHHNASGTANIFPASAILHLPASVISCSSRPTDCNFRKISLTVSENSKPYNKYILEKRKHFLYSLIPLRTITELNSCHVF